MARFTIGSGPLYGAGTDTVAVIVALAPGARVGMVQGNAVQAPVMVPKASPVGGGSLMTTSVAVEGPALLATIVNVIGLPAVTLPGLPLLMAWQSADGLIVVSSVALSSRGLGSIVPAGGVTVAVLPREPVASGANVPVAVNVADPPAGRSTVVAIGPLPLVTAQLPPALALQVQVTPV